MILLDDTGWSDLGCYGSEIRTPHIDALSRNGLTYNNFHVTPLCSPTRACLMTGRNHHSIGMRCLADSDTGFPNSRGAIHASVPLLPQLLRDQGYASYMVGKWHLTPSHEITPAGPFGQWPLQRGFDRFFGFLPGCTDHYSPELIEDNHSVEPKLGEDYHLSEDLADRAATYLREHRMFRGNAPFFMNFWFGATHAPFQVPNRYIEPYVPVFEKGWDATRADRLARQKSIGLVPEDTELTPRNPEVPPWDDVQPDAKRLYTRLQACFAGFLEHADEQIGRLMAELRRLDLYDNTLVLVMSDNGASREGGDHGAIDTNSNYSGQPESVAAMLPRLEDIGGARGPAFYPQGWAMAGNTPFRRYKQYVELGGVRSPLVVHWPCSTRNNDAVRNQFLHAIDIAPTLMDVAGLSESVQIDGASFAESFKRQEAPAPRSTQYWEMFGRRAVYSDGWKAVSSHEKGDDYAEDKWRLYDLGNDFSENRDLSIANPERLARLQDAWWKEAANNDVFPLDDRTLVEFIKFRQPNGVMAENEITLFPATAHIPQSTMITSSERSMDITAYFNGAVGNAQGVLLSAGDSMGGYVLFLQGGALYFEHVWMGDRIRVDAAVDRDAEWCGVRMRVCEEARCKVALATEKGVVARTEIPKVAVHLSFWGLDVGRDAGKPVSDAYSAPFEFPDRLLDRVALRFHDEPHRRKLVKILEMAE